MNEAETPPEAKPESPNLAQGTSVKVSQAKSPKENGVRVKEGSNGTNCDLDGGGTPQVDSVHKSGGNEGGVEDSEVNGVASLLHGLVSAADIIDQNEKMAAERGCGGSGSGGGDGDSYGVSLVADVCGDVNANPSDAEEKRQGDGCLASELKANEGNSDAKNREAEEEDDDGDDGKTSKVDEEDGSGDAGKNSEAEEEDNSGDEGHDYGVGDFIWGKIRSHPWWPGRVYDPVDASDFAKKVKQGDKILVAYFGDGTFAWCNPSQLKPLDDDFVEMSKQSNSKNFVNAVEKAMDEVSRLVDLKMTCSCVPKDNLIGFGRTLAVNAGIREGLLIPEGGIHKLSSTYFEPAAFLASLKEASQVCTVTNFLEITVLKSWLSAFYRAKNGHQLPSYYDPKPIPGLEDESRNRMVDISGYNNRKEVRVHGPVEDWLSSPRKYDQTNDSGTLQRCEGVSVGGPCQRKKQKSLAEILEGQIDADVENKDDALAEEVVELSKSTTSAKRKKRKSTGENPGADGEVMDATEGADMGKQASSSGRKKRKASGNPEGKSKTKDAAKVGKNVDEPRPESRGKKRKAANDAHVDKDGSKTKNKNTVTPKSSKPRSGKEAKLSESTGRGNRKGTSPNADGSSAKNETVTTRQRKKRENSNVEDDGGGDKNEVRVSTGSAGKVKGSPSRRALAKELVRKDSLLRERKRSKYLSPPYTNLNKGQRKNEVAEQLLKVSAEAQEAEESKKVVGKLVGSPPILKPAGEKSQKKTPKEAEIADGSGLQSPKQDRSKVVDPTVVKTPASEILSMMRSAALSPLHPKETTISSDEVRDFVSAFRNSSSCNMTDGAYSQLRSGKRRKYQKSESGSMVKEQNQTDRSTPVQKSHRTKTEKSEEAKVDKPKVKETVNAPTRKKKDKEPSEEASGAALVVSFGPGSSLPTKKELSKIYGKYGALNKAETEMLKDNSCARIVFLKTSEAEEAFNESQLSSPFKSANATFRLQYLSAETKTRELRNIPTSKSSSRSKKGAKTKGIALASQSPNTNVSQLKFIKQKLESVTSLVETSAGKISPDVKSILEGEMKVILEKVSSMVDSSS